MTDTYTLTISIFTAICMGFRLRPAYRCLSPIANETENNNEQL
jgi:hypothetical protein